MPDIKLPPEALFAVSRLEEAGYPCYAVGGFVRDALKGDPCHDVDLTTAASPEEMRRVFAGEKLIATGEKHGTLTLVKDGVPLEITTFRADMPYLDGRHPSGVRFSGDIREDLARRDFTINAMAYSPTRGLVDPFGGRRDLKARVLKCVGVPRERFTEDALRLLRALRFAARFSLKVDGPTAEAITACAPRIALVSRERIASEMDGLLSAPGVVDIALRFSEVLFCAVQELRPMAGCLQRCPYHIYDVWEHSLRAVENVPPVSLLRWCALLHDVGKPAARVTDETGQDHFKGHEEIGARMAVKILEGLKMPRRFIGTAERLIRLHDRRFKVPEVKSVMRLLGAEDTRSLILLQRGDLLAHSPMIAEKAADQLALLGEVDRVEMSGEPYTLKQLAVTGDDLIREGMRGPGVGQALEEALTAVMVLNIPNEKDTIMDWIRRNLM